MDNFGITIRQLIVPDSIPRDRANNYIRLATITTLVLAALTATFIFRGLVDSDLWLAVAVYIMASIGLSQRSRAAAVTLVIFYMMDFFTANFLDKSLAAQGVILAINVIFLLGLMGTFALHKKAEMSETLLEAKNAFRKRWLPVLIAVLILTALSTFIKHGSLPSENEIDSTALMEEMSQNWEMHPLYQEGFLIGSEGGISPDNVDSDLLPTFNDKDDQFVFSYGVARGFISTCLDSNPKCDEVKEAIADFHNESDEILNQL